MNSDSRPLSTSALAKALGKTTRQMFSELESLGWILRKDDSWVLTSKGEFEGGLYRESQKFGRYIIWPVTVAKHKALTNPNAGLITLHKIAKHFQLADKYATRLISELGWIKPERKGWVLTPKGESTGGLSREDSKTGVPYVLWPEDILDNKALSDWVDQLTTKPANGLYLCCDGHQVVSAACRDIDNWLYLSGIAHAVKRKLSEEDEQYADFYLPTYQIYIEYWGEQVVGEDLARKMKRRDYYQKFKHKVIEISDEDLNDLETTLPRLLLKQGVEI